MPSSSLSLQTRDVAVVGLGLSGMSTLKWFSDRKIVTRAFDDNPQLQEQAENLGALWTPLHKGLLDNAEALVLSPGIPHSGPHAHPIALHAQNYNIPIISDIEIFARTYPHATLIAITGTNGKSTLVSLIAHLLNASSHHAIASGNIGLPVLDVNMDKNPTLVLELSSYQLERCPSLSPHISIITNITPDHFAHHNNSEQLYRHAKLQLFQQTRTGGVILIDPSLAQDVDVKKILASKKDETLQLFLSPPSPKDNLFHITLPGGSSFAIPPENPLNGKSGASLTTLALAAIASHDPSLFLSHDKTSHILNALASFSPLPHRQEIVTTFNNVTIINDSKATNPEATVAALQRFSHIFWIAGGEDKNTPLTPLIPHLHNIHSAYLIGEAAPRIKSFLKKYSNHPNIFCCHSLENATQKALADATSFASPSHHATPSRHPTLLLSPLCASFDQFENFHHRGNHFKSCILTLTHHDKTSPSPTLP